MIVLRNVGYSKLLVGYFVGPLSGVTPDLVHRALRDAVSSPRGLPLRRRLGSGGIWRTATLADAVDAARLAVRASDRPLEREEQVERALEVRFSRGDVPVRILVDGGWLAFTFPHSLVDGTGGIELVELIVEKLARPGVDEIPARPVAERPLLAALRRFSLADPAGIRTARDTFRRLTAETETGYQLERTLQKSESIEASRLVSLVLEPAVVRTVAATPEQPVGDARPARPPVSLKVASLVLRSVRDCAAPGIDFRVVVPIDGRRWTEKGSSVDGNFSPSVPMGRLVGTDWSATALLGRIASATRSGLPITWLLASVLLAMKGAVLAPLSSLRAPDGTPRIPFEIHLSIPSREVSVPHELLPEVTPDTLVGGVPGHLDHPLGVWIEVSPIRDCLHVTVRDETGTLDLDDFEGRLRAMIAAAVEAASLG